MSDNVFAALAQFASSREEDYLTECLVFLMRLLLARSAEHGLELINLVAKADKHPLFEQAASVRIETQFATEQGRPDIVIQSDATIVFVEVKHDSPLGAEQLERYYADLLQSTIPVRRLVLLTRSRYSEVPTTLAASQFARLYWYQIYDWLEQCACEDAVCRYFLSGLMEFLEEKRMSVKRVSEAYLEGISALLNLYSMIEVAAAEVYSGNRVVRTGGLGWRGLYLPDRIWFGMRYGEPGLVVFENNNGNTPTFRRALDLSETQFFVLEKQEQLEAIIAFLSSAAREYADMPQE